MTTGYVYHRAGLDRAALDALLGGLGGLAFVIDHSATRIRCGRWPTAERLPAGRAFGRELEARWWPSGDGYEAQIIRETPGAPGPGWSETRLEADPAHTITLWGRHWQAQSGTSAATPDGWVQAEIPAELRYPVDGGRERPLVQATAITYRRDGRPQLTRFLSLRATGEGDNSQ